MFKDGYINIVNIDFSAVVIQDMQSRFPQMIWKEMDVMNMREFNDSSFDIVIDKGTMDAVMCEQGDVWEVEPEIAERVHKMCSEIHRVLKPGGIFYYITFGQPHFRRPLLKKDCYNWSFEYETIGDCFHYYAFIMRKNQ
eukprot:TRINITY_DN1129_c0_g2_i1.p1 TRINITY_DN1129_c0_g2~~TRINITY_DN1129_c0_g2_i1.p1  ORF type:complete len:139 (-),score=37.08 TRINITY_DN1129_c0_g2_i1:53-469(-)